MDKIAVISDVHGNIPALEAVLSDIKQRGIELIYNLGDLVGKGGRSDLAVDMCRDVCAKTVRGNWDDALTNPAESPLAEWYREQLGEERLAYLAELPHVIDFWMSGKAIRLYHASQEGVYTRRYPWDSREIHHSMFENTEFTGMDNPTPHIVGYGDIHSAYMLIVGEGKLLFNAGSVGNPLDFPLATYAILTGKMDGREDAPFSMDFVRLPYDIELAIEQARQVNLPDVDKLEIELRTAVYRGRQKDT